MVCKNSIGLKFGHALAKFAQRVAVLNSSFTPFAFIKYRWAQIAFILDLCCFCIIRFFPLPLGQAEASFHSFSL